MTLPASWQTVRVFGTYKRFDTGEAAHGAVTFEPVLVTAPEGAGRTVVLPKPRTVALDVAGKIDIQLPATDDPDIAPTGWAYRVTEKIGRSEARAYFIHVPLAGGDIDLATAPQVVPIDPMVAYLSSADIGVNVASQAAATSLDARVDALEASPGGGAWGTITGTLAAQTDLQAALDSKATAAQGAKADTALQSETDPTVPAWAKAPTKPSYTAGEVGADASGTAASAVTAHVAASDPHPQYTTTSEAAAAAPVQSVAGKTGAVSLVAADIGGLGTAATQATGAFATAAQGTKADSAIQPGNAALSDAREWTAATVTQAEAEAGTDTARKAWSVLRVWQAMAAWWDSTPGKLKLDKIRLADNNVGIGTQAHASITTADYNTAIGKESQKSLSTGYTNVGIGYAAQTGMVAGDYNVGVGALCQSKINGAVYNLGVGYRCQYNITIGSYNAAIGSDAQYSITSGSSNLAIGAQSQYAVTTGSFNIGIGKGAQGNLVSANNNVAIGYNAHRQTGGGVNITASEDCVFVGGSTRAAANGGTNEVVVGCYAVGNGSNTATIGNTSQKYALINGTIASGASIVASLPSAASVPVGSHYFATNGRKSGEGAGAGTGVPVWSDGTNWRTYYDNSTVTA